MNVRRTIVYWVVFLLLAGYWAAFERNPRPVTDASVKKESIIPEFADDIHRVTFEREDVRVVLERGEDKRFDVIEPDGLSAPSDLVSTLVDVLTEKQEANVISENPADGDLATFGLKKPLTVFRFETKDGEKYTVELGSRSPTRTAVYAHTSLSPRVILLGLNIQYYGDLLYEAAVRAKRA